jgi:hypothetical protein
MKETYRLEQVEKGLCFLALAGDQEFSSITVLQNNSNSGTYTNDIKREQLF